MGLFDWLRRPRPKPGPPPVVPGDTNMESLYAAINAYRVRNRRQALSLNVHVEQIAQIHSQTMADRAKMHHGDFVARLHAQFPGQIHSASENIGWNYPTSQAAVVGWINSLPHRQNLLGTWNTFGAGVARNQKTGEPYWCVVFANIR